MVTDTYLGSQLVVPTPVLRERIESLQNKAREALEEGTNDEALLVGHNYFTAYTVLMLLHGTGHRPVKDPFCYPWHVKQGFALVTDKVSSPNHELRLSVVPPRAMEQIGHYRTHLQSLATLLSEKAGWTKLSQAIAVSLHRPRALPGLPQFFFLDEAGSYSISRSSLLPWLEPWPWGLNLGRKQVWQGLWDRGVRPEWVRRQVGHAERGETPWGNDTLYSPWGFGAIQFELEAILEEQGWQPLEGWSAPEESITGLPPTESVDSVDHRPAVLGPEARRRERDRKAANYRAIIRGHIRAVGDPYSEGKDSLNEEQARLILRRIQAEFPGRPDIKDWAANLVRRWLRAKRGLAHDIPQRRSVEAPAFPFPEDWLEKLEYARRRQAAFLEFLESQKGPSKSTEEPQGSGSKRLAEIVTSAALLGGLCTKDRLTALPQALMKTTWRLDGALMVDASEAVGHAHQPSWRWRPDSVSSGLIASWFGNWEAEEPATNTFRADLRRLLNRLGGDLAGTQDPFEALAEWARPLFEFQMPGLFRGSWTENRGGAPLPRSAWHRLSANKRLPYGRDEGQASQTPMEDAEPEGDSLPFPQASQECRSKREFLRALRRVLREAASTEAQKGRSRDRKQKEALVKGLQGLFPANHTYPCVAMALAEWGIHLVKAGTPHQKKLKFSTVATYLRQVAAPMAATAWDMDFLQTEPEDREALLQEAIDYPGTEEEQARLGFRLRDFHAFLEDRHGLEPLDWGFLPVPAQDNPAEAQLLTPAEYRKALALLQEGSQRAPGEEIPAADLAPDRVLPAVALVLGYRYGLRSGEVFRVRGRDLQFRSDGEIGVVHVRANPYGTPKSRAGRRSIPNVEPLEDQELALLDAGLRIASRLDGSGGGEASIFADPDSPGRLRGRGWIVNRVQLAMRRVSGEPKLRFHHLRHGYANRVFLGMVADQWPEVRAWPAVTNLMRDLESGPEVRWRLAERRRLDEDAVEAFAKAMGHANPATTARHYLHGLDQVIQAIMDQQFPRPLGIKAWSYVLWQSGKTLKQRGQQPDPPALPWARGWLDPIAPLDIPAPRGAIGNLPRSSEGGQLPTLKGIDEFLLANLEVGGDVERAAKRVGFSEEMGRTLQAVALEVAEETWFKGLIPESEGQGQSNPSLSPLRRASPKVRKGLEEWDKLLPAIGMEELNEGFRLWRRGHQQQTGLIWLVRQGEFDHFFRLAWRLGFVGELEVRPAPASKIGQPPSSLKQLFQTWGLSMGKVASMDPPQGLWVNPEWLGGVAVKPGGQWSYIQRLNRALFCLAVWLQLAQRHRNEKQGTILD